MEPTEYHITSSRDAGLLLIGLTGQATRDNAGRIAADVIALVTAERADRVLVDCTRIGGRLGVTDTYYHVREYRLGDHRPRRVAVIDLPEHAEYFTFHETAAANVGYGFLRYFSDPAAARRWAAAQE
ncbi:MAG TPA: hypothetical protein VF796_26015 [Humisphaera sp.]